MDCTTIPETGQRESLELALRCLTGICPFTPVIVETATLRNESPRGRHGDGWSSLAWSWFAARTGGTFPTVDIDPDCLDACRRLILYYSRLSLDQLPPRQSDALPVCQLPSRIF